MAYHVPTSAPRRLARTWWIWLLWIAGISSCGVGIRYVGQFRKPLTGSVRTIGDSIRMQEWGLSLLLILLILIGIVACIKRFWKGAWISMALINGLFMLLSIALVNHAARLVQRFNPSIWPGWAETAAIIPWLLIGGSGIIILAAVLALTIDSFTRNHPFQASQLHPEIRIEHEGHDA